MLVHLALNFSAIVFYSATLVAEGPTGKKSASINTYNNTLSVVDVSSYWRQLLIQGFWGPVTQCLIWGIKQYFGDLSRKPTAPITQLNDLHVSSLPCIAH